MNKACNNELDLNRKLIKVGVNFRKFYLTDFTFPVIMIFRVMKVKTVLQQLLLKLHFHQNKLDYHKN